MDEFELGVLADLTALRYVVENIGKIACIAAGLDGDLVTQLRSNLNFLLGFS